MEKPGNLGPVCSLGSEDSDRLLLPGELDLFGQGPLGPAHNRIILVRNRAVCCVMKSGPMCTCAMEGFQNECLGL